ncbi:hypothetical protein [Stappia sp. ICDLI1TA098]
MFHVITPLKLSENIEVMRAQLDAAARDLDRRRAQHERRPDDQGAYVRFLEAALAFEKLRARLEVLDLARRNVRLQRHLDLASRELARRCAQVEAFGRLSSTIKCRRGEPAARPARRAKSGDDLFAADEGRVA